jgi:Abnormal spindle-like microcephaly-assoc'd, ASPM-SPD-2-Hydin
MKSNYGSRASAVALSLVLIIASMSPSTAAADGTRPLGSLVIEANTEDGFFDFGFSALEETSEQTLVVTNPSSELMTSLVGTILNPHFRFKGGPYPGLGGTCTKELEPNAECKIVMTFKPKELGEKRALVRINYWEGPTPKTSFRPLIGSTDPSM